MSIRKHPLWPVIASHIKVETYARDGGHHNPRFRLEIGGDVTEEQRNAWIQIEVPCAACGRPVHPIRERRPGGRMSSTHLYLAACCPLNVNIGCSRGRRAHEEYLTIRREVEATQSAPG